jgi:hypothetical protein
MDDFIAPESQVSVENTRGALSQLVRGDQIGGILDNPQLTGIKQVLDDVDGVVDFDTLKAIRSTIGRKLGSNDLISDIPRAELKQIYGALTQDLEAAAAASGEAATKAFRRANNFTRSGHNRLDDFVERVTKKVDLDKVFRAVTKGGEGTQTINAFKRSLKPEEWNVVVSNVIRQLGKATSGQQDDLGQAFSLNKFVTDWDKLGTAKKALFSGTKELNKMGKDLDSIAQTASRVKESSKELAGQSGTAQLATAVGTGGATAGALLSGNLQVAGTIMSLVAANNGAARLMSSPRFVNWLATTSKMPPEALSRQIAKLGVIAQQGDPAEAEAIGEFIIDAKGAEQQTETVAAQ